MTLKLNEFFEQCVELHKGVHFKFLDNSNSHIGAFICKKIVRDRLIRPKQDDRINKNERTQKYDHRNKNAKN